MNPTILLQAGLTRILQELDRSRGKCNLLSCRASICLQLIVYLPSTRLMPPPEVKLSQGTIGISWFFTLLSSQRNDIAVNLHSCKSHEVCAYVLHPLMQPTGFSSVHIFNHRLWDTLGGQKGRKSIVHVTTLYRV